MVTHPITRPITAPVSRALNNPNKPTPFNVVVSNGQLVVSNGQLVVSS